MAIDYPDVITIAFILTEASILLVGLRLLRNHRKAISVIAQEEGLSLSSPSGSRHYLSIQSFVIPLGVAAVILGMLTFFLLMAIFSDDSGDSEPFSAPDQLFIFTTFIAIGVILPWLAFVEVSLPRALVVESGVWNITGLKAPFLTRWDEIERVSNSRYPTREQWYVVKGPNGRTRIRSGAGIGLFSVKLIERVPEERWSSVSGAMDIVRISEAMSLSSGSEAQVVSSDRSALTEHEDVMHRSDAVGKCIVISSLFILTSSGVMLWAMFDVATDPSYGGFETVWDYVWWICITLLHVGAIATLVIAYTRFQARYFLIAATLSGLSFLGPMAVVAQIVAWMAHSRYGLPW